MKVDVYVDVICPWCYIGERRFARALASFPGAHDLEVAFRPFQLDPAAPDRPIPLLGALRSKFGPRMRSMIQHVTEAAAREGIAIDWERAVSVNTLTAHRLLGLAEREYGGVVQQALLERLFDAHFSRGGNVADHELLAELAEDAGMDQARARDSLASGEGLDEVRHQLAEARAVGVRAVPTFVFDEQYAVEGAQPPEVFRQVLEEVTKGAAA